MPENEVMSDWISVEDRLPEAGQGVIYYFEPVGVHVGHYSRFDGVDIFAGPAGFLGDDVTYWMPLPPPPEVNDASR